MAGYVPSVRRKANIEKGKIARHASGLVLVMAVSV